MEKNEPSVSGLRMRDQISQERSSASIPFDTDDLMEMAVFAERRMTLESIKTISAFESPPTETISPTRTESPTEAEPPFFATSPSA